MSTRVDLTALIAVPEDSEAWAHLRPELPHNATLLAATLHIEPGTQYLLLTYRGATARRVRHTTEDGSQETVEWVPHQRQSQQRVPLTVSQAWALLEKAYPRDQRTGTP